MRFGTPAAIVIFVLRASALRAQDAAGAWTKLAAVEGNAAAKIVLRFDPVEVTRLRVLIVKPSAAGGDYARIGEIAGLTAYGRARPFRVEADSTGEGFSAEALDDGDEDYDEDGAVPKGWASAFTEGKEPHWVVFHFGKPVALREIRIATAADAARAVAAVEVQAPAAELAAAKAKPAAAKRGGPAPAAPRPLPKDRIESLGDFLVTYYYLADEKDHEGEPADTDILNPGGKALARVPAKFASALRIEGCGRLKDGRVLTVASNNRYVVSDTPYGHGARGALEPFRSIAVDPSLIKLGTKLYIAEMVGAELPDGTRHDGVFTAQDTGGAIKGQHIDLFAGVRSWAPIYAKQGIRSMQKVALFKVRD